jgi:tetratricopeptide (TPR) repeat protein
MKVFAVRLFLALASQGDFDALFQRGLDLARSGRELEALECFREAHRIAPEDSAVLYNTGNLLDRLGHAGEAIDAFREAAARAPEEPSIQLALGGTLYRAGRTRESITPLANVLEKTAPPAEAFELLAAAYEAEGELGRSIETLARYLELWPDDAEARVLLGKQLAAQSRYQEAIATWKEGLGRGRLVAELHYRIGEALSRAPETFAESESSLRQALAVEPSHLEASLLLARLLLRARRAEEGLFVLLAPSELHPDSPDVLFVLANLHQQLGEVERAEAARARFHSLSAEAERRAQNEARVHVTYKRARELLDRGQMLEAQKEFRAVLELDSKNALACSMLAKIAFSRGELEEARRWIGEALSRDPSQGEFHYLDGLFAARTAEAGEAERSVRRSLESMPGFADAWLLLGVLLIDSDRVQEGVDSFRKAEILEPSNPTVYLNLAAAYQKAGQAEMADAALARYRELSASGSVKR